MRTGLLAVTVERRGVVAHALVIGLVAACGGDDGDSTGGSDGDAGPDPFHNVTGEPYRPSIDAGSAVPSQPAAEDPAPVLDPYEADECDVRQVRCRGVCFSEAGQSRAGCEVIYLSERRIDAAHFGTDTAYLEIRTQMLQRVSVARLDLTTGELTAIIDDFQGFNDVQIYEGALYTLGRHEPWGDKDTWPVMRLSDEGSFEPAAGILGQWQFADWKIFDGEIYMVASDEDNNDSIYRLALGEALDTPFRPESEPGAELLVEGVVAKTMATDGTYLYYGSRHTGFGLGRVLIGDPSTGRVLNEEWAYNFVQHFSLPEADPDHVYFTIAEGLHRVPRVGGPSELVLEYPGLDRWASDEEILAHSSVRGLRLINIAPPTETILDEDTVEPIGYWGQDDGFYLAHPWGIVRIDRP